VNVKGFIAVLATTASLFGGGYAIGEAEDQSRPCAETVQLPAPTPSQPDFEAACGQIPFTPPLRTGYANGRLPASALAPIAQGHLRKDAAAAFNAMNVESRFRYGVTIVPLGPVSDYRPYDDQVRIYRTCSRAGWCAYPGTSNHGWGLAIDLANQKMRAIINVIGRKYGWSKACSDASWEWWHIKWNPACTGAKRVWKDPGPYGKAAPACSGRRVKVGKKCYPILKKGVRGRFEAVKLVSRILDRHCLKTPNHGKYTLAVRKDVRKFQRRAHLHADGVIATRTWKKLLVHRRHNHTC
jgi:hypothetical protein